MRFVEPPHVGVAGSEKAVCVRETGIVLDSQEERRQRFIETPAEEMRASDYNGRPAATGARAETQRVFDVLDCCVQLPGPQPDDAADMLATCEARVERQRSIDQRHDCTDVFTKI